MHPALGIDYGKARIGIAATDPMGILAFPIQTLRVAEIIPYDQIVQLANKHRVKTIVIGLPVRYDGTEGSAAAAIRQFGDILRQRLPDIPISYIDEYLTTVIATEKLIESGRKTKKHRPVIDQAAAVEILNRWMQATGQHLPEAE